MANTTHTYRVIQLTNKSIGAQDVDTYLPLGKITRRINCKNYESVPFSTASSDIDAVVVNETGYYRVTYTASLVASAAGIITVNLVTNENTVYSVSETAAEGATVNLAFVYEIRVCPNSDCNPYNVPVNIQTQLTTTAISSGTSNLLVEKVY